MSEYVILLETEEDDPDSKFLELCSATELEDFIKPQYPSSTVYTIADKRDVTLDNLIFLLDGINSRNKWRELFGTPERIIESMKIAGATETLIFDTFWNILQAGGLGD